MRLPFQIQASVYKSCNWVQFSSWMNAWKLSSHFNIIYVCVCVAFRMSLIVSLSFVVCKIISFAFVAFAFALVTLWSVLLYHAINIDLRALHINNNDSALFIYLFSFFSSSSFLFISFNLFAGFMLCSAFNTIELHNNHMIAIIKRVVLC